MYKTSKDYGRLWELAQEINIICWCDNNLTPCVVNRDCSRIYVEMFNYTYKHDPDLEESIMSNLEDKEDFIKQCKEHNLEFIDPEPPTCETCAERPRKYKPLGTCLVLNVLKENGWKASDFWCVNHKESEEN